MQNFTKLTKIANIPNGSMKGFSVSDNQILVANVDGRFYAMDAICSS